MENLYHGGIDGNIYGNIYGKSGNERILSKYGKIYVTCWENMKEISYQCRCSSIFNGY